MEIGFIITGSVFENGGRPGKCNRSNWRAVGGGLVVPQSPGNCEIFATLFVFLEPQGTNLVGVMQGHFGAFHYLWLEKFSF